MCPLKYNTRRLIRQCTILGLFIALIASLFGASLFTPSSQAADPFAAAQQDAPRGPQPGDVFREYHYTTLIKECGDDAVQRPYKDGFACDDSTRMNDRTIWSLDKNNARKAEVAVQLWGGHVGTMNQQFVVNRSRANFSSGTVYNIDQGRTPGRAECYFRNPLGTSITPISLNDLQNGTNVFRFRSGNQANCPGIFGWGHYWIYGFTARIYYNNQVTAPTGRIVSPTNGTRIGENPTFVVEAAAPQGRTIVQVDLVGEYYDYDYDGNGIYREWQYRIETVRRGDGWHTGWTRTIGSKNNPDQAGGNRYSFPWNTDWLPDQDAPVRLMARITDSSGLSYLTDAVTVEFRRGGRSVQMFTTTFLPQNFGVREDRKRMDATIAINGDLSGTTQARLVMSTWAGDPGRDEQPETWVALNGNQIGRNNGSNLRMFGRDHWYSDDVLRINNLGWLRTGNNTFTMYADRKGHAMEVHNPGPAIQIQRSVPNRAPVASAPETGSAAYQTSLTISGLSIDDPDASDADTLEVRLAAPNGTLNLATQGGLTFREGANGSGQMTVRGPMAQLNAALRDLSYRPNNGFSGTDTLTLSVNDLAVGGGNPLSASATTRITVGGPGQPPPPPSSSPLVVPDYTANAVVNGVLNIDVLAGVRGGASPELASITQPRQGRATMNTDGRTVTYTPEEDFTGQDSFTYTVRSSNGQTATGTVSISITSELVRARYTSFLPMSKR